MTIKKLFLLPAGRCLVDKSALNTNLAIGEMADLPIWSYLIETSDGPILVDTGMPESCVHDPEDYFKDTEDEGLIVPKMHKDDAILQVLARVGYKPENLLCVVSSHWHFDHAGGNSHFPQTPIIVQRAEHDAAMNSPESYPQECRIPGLKYQLIEGDYEVVPGVNLLFTPGHAPGHQSILVNTAESGQVLLTIDAAYTRENFEDGVPFAGFNQAQAAKSLERLKDLVRSEKPKVFYGHDIAQGEEWNKFPLHY